MWSNFRCTHNLLSNIISNVNLLIISTQISLIKREFIGETKRKTIINYQYNLYIWYSAQLINVDLCYTGKVLFLNMIQGNLHNVWNLSDTVHNFAVEMAFRSQFY